MSEWAESEAKFLCMVPGRAMSVILVLSKWLLSTLTTIVVSCEMSQLLDGHYTPNLPSGWVIISLAFCHVRVKTRGLNSGNVFNLAEESKLLDVKCRLNTGSHKWLSLVKCCLKIPTENLVFYILCKSYILLRIIIVWCRHSMTQMWGRCRLVMMETMVTPYQQSAGLMVSAGLRGSTVGIGELQGH